MISFLVFWGILFVVMVPHVMQLEPVSSLPENAVAAVGLIIALSIVAVAIMSLRVPIRRANRPGMFLALLLVALVAIIPFSFLLDAFGAASVGSVLITLKENPAGDILSIGLKDFAPDVTKYVLFVIGSLGSGLALLMLTSRAGAGISAACLGAIVLSPVSEYAFHSVVPDKYHALITAEDVIEPVIVSGPALRKNLVIIYLESLERTYRDLPQTSAQFRAFAGIEDRAISFRNIGQVSGTGFTAGGMVATQCGVPVVPYGVFNVRKKIHDDVRRIPDFRAFMTGVTCLGDILAADGYNASYINGSDLSIFSKGDFFRSHGYQRVFGLTSYDGWETEPRRNVWGMDDDLLFERVTDELRYLASREKPFVLSTLTIATHGPDGFLDGDCRPPRGADARIGAAIRCTGDHVEALLDVIGDLGIADQTLVLVTSDHLAFRNSLWDDLERFRDQRRNYVALLGAGPARAMDQIGSMIDIFPTLLEAMGYTLQDGRANLGQSLFSVTSTLSETYGYEGLSRAIRGNPDLQKMLWRAPEDDHGAVAVLR